MDVNEGRQFSKDFARQEIVRPVVNAPAILSVRIVNGSSGHFGENLWKRSDRRRRWNVDNGSEI
jgi:hypothetical protein